MNFTSMDAGAADCTAQVGLIICCIVISRQGERPVQQSLDLAARVGRELMRYENERRVKVVWMLGGGAITITITLTQQCSH